MGDAELDAILDSALDDLEEEDVGPVSAPTDPPHDAAGVARVSAGQTRRVSASEYARARRLFL
eukprot:8561454-Alexandrium_andersonii.AAC.1